MKKIKNLKMMWKFSDETGNYEVSMPMLAVKAAGCVIALMRENIPAMPIIWTGVSGSI